MLGLPCLPEAETHWVEASGSTRPPSEWKGTLGVQGQAPSPSIGKVPFLLWDRLRQTVGSAPIPETKINN